MKSKFALADRSVMFQLIIHFNNFLIYWHPEKRQFRYPNEQSHEYDVSSSHMIEMLRHFIEQPETMNFYERRLAPSGFRLVQLIHHYGANAIIQYIFNIYGKDIGLNKTIEKAI